MLFTDPRVGNHSLDLEPGEARLEIGEVVRKKGRVPTSGSTAGRWQHPIGSAFLVQDLPGVTVIPINHSTT